ncbi:hypothetical protein [Streptomyces tsukubensis]|uniref:Uncharacterized protein n=1 Tax=Streptomyces tsukubensis TaxID=83656 RepID=A0A1V4A6R8_9ACTN|nr:hypothetical protein [Streptomyces tsukubensis]OON77279.1 hypothetical protein B1H18_18680 [Streptomyces tsukubensis]QFR92354.1 hypothetical protein GBW32_03905 [Streptomyces tsukubensis]
MYTDGARGWEAAVLDGGPADGVRMRVADRPGVVQVTYPCQVEPRVEAMQVEALYVYRRDPRVRGEPLRYGFDGATP